jgi:hypothetical protein
MRKRCKCAKLTRVQPDGYQYCHECNKAHAAPALKRGEEGQHELEDIKIGGVMRANLWSNDWSHQVVIQQRCKLCNMRFAFNETTGDYMGQNPDRTKCLPLGQIALTRK